jgi:deoxyribose-phosphate aldolase
MSALSKADAALAIRALKLIDLTDLSDSCSETAIVQLCQRALVAPGPVAAVCIWPQFVSLARRTLGETSPVKIATVVNFPAGGSYIARAVDDATEALGDGADEIDLVLPWRAFLEGDEEIATEMVREVKAACEGGTLKVILESGMIGDVDQVRRAADLAITGGADFIKTSTGKTARSATPEAARVMLEAIRAAARTVGLKPSGGIRTLEDARLYLGLADALMGTGWATPATFRFGASGLHQALLDALAGAETGAGEGAY